MSSLNTDDDYEEDPFLVGTDFYSPHSEDPEPTENNCLGVEEWRELPSPERDPGVTVDIIRS